MRRDLLICLSKSEANSIARELTMPARFGHEKSCDSLPYLLERQRLNQFSATPQTRGENFNSGQGDLRML
jgi:hypothetical protein